MTAWGDAGDGTYINPVLFSDFSDPDAVVVGDDVYLTASSFNCVPGLPLLHSRDLVNWSLIGYALERLPSPRYDRPQYGGGVWAPSLRFHDGRFWIVFGMPDEGLFVTWAEHPAGPWSDVHCLAAGRGLIDPCPFWDEDGQAYVIHALAASRAGRNSVLILRRVTPDLSRCLDEGRVIIDGHHHHPIVEGPKLYRRNGYVYVFAPAGGVKGGWQTVFRSRHIEGPYEDRIVLCQGNSDVNGPHQGAWVENAAGESWFLHFQDRGPYGRVVHLQPVRWQDDWPLVGGQTHAPDVTEPVRRHRKPTASGPVPAASLPASDRFDGDRLGLQWQWMANPRPSWGTLGAEGLCLTCQPSADSRGNWWQAGHLLLQKLQGESFEVTCEISLEDAAAGDSAGLMLFSGTCGAAVLKRTATGIVLEMQTQTRDAPQPRGLQTVPWEDPRARLRLVMDRGRARWFYGDAAGGWVSLGEPLEPRDAAWMGAKVGLFALSPERRASGGRAVVQSFIVTPLKGD